jgi:hypothetical protein
MRAKGKLYLLPFLEVSMLTALYILAILAAAYVVQCETHSKLMAGGILLVGLAAFL